MGRDLSAGSREKQRPRGLSDELSDSDDSSNQKEPTTGFTADLPDSLHKRLKMQATIEEGRSMKVLVVEAIKQYLDRHEYVSKPVRADLSTAVLCPDPARWSVKKLGALASVVREPDPDSSRWRENSYLRSAGISFLSP